MSAERGNLFQSYLGIVAGPCPDGLAPISEQIIGRGFFPVVSGSFVDDETRAPFQRSVMFVGQDFENESNVAACAKKDNDISQGTGLRLKRLIEETAIPLDHCFLTNALWGVRRTKINTGASPGWKDQGFVDRCCDGLMHQIDVVQPRAIVALGLYAPMLLAKIFPGCAAWNEATFKAIDANGNGLVLCEPSGTSVCILGILVHPSYSHVNAPMRRFRNHEGRNAEIALLNELWLKIQN